MALLGGIPRVVGACPGNHHSDLHFGCFLDISRPLLLGAAKRRKAPRPAAFFARSPSSHQGKRHLASCIVQPAAGTVQLVFVAPVAPVALWLCGYVTPSKTPPGGPMSVPARLDPMSFPSAYCG